ncbi:hypothetical protein EG329_004912 [Mollisiaceae sp. DMI_Dod_QoI]|nr:hypothetical protein EG329_004912 [Helotiales sp. DMI_Dod_QoI]
MSDLATATRAVVGENNTNLAEAYAPNHDSAEKAIPGLVQNMQTDEGVRQRHLQGQSTPTIDELETSARSTTLTTSVCGTDNLGAQDAASVSVKWQQEYDKIKHRQVEDSAPHMPRLAALQDSNESFCIFRRFGPSASRILLVKELELDQITKKLDALDHADNENPDRRYRLKGIEHHDGWPDEQQNLLQELEVKLNVYYNFLLKYSDVRDLKPVDFRHHRSIHNYVVRNRPLYETEAAFLHDIDDFVYAKRASGNDIQQSRIEDWLESRIARRPRTRLHNFLKNSPEGRKSTNELIHGFSRKRLAMLAKIIVASLAMGTLFIPVFIMFLSDLSKAKMACVLAVFVSIFMVMMSVLVDLTPHDFFIVVAAQIFGRPCCAAVQFDPKIRIQRSLPMMIIDSDTGKGH